jgi:hypothetical protein
MDEAFSWITEVDEGPTIPGRSQYEEDLRGLVIASLLLPLLVDQRTGLGRLVRFRGGELRGLDVRPCRCGN